MPFCTLQLCQDWLKEPKDVERRNTLTYSCDTANVSMSPWISSAHASFCKSHVNGSGESMYSLPRGSLQRCFKESDPFLWLGSDFWYYGKTLIALDKTLWQQLMHRHLISAGKGGFRGLQQKNKTALLVLWSTKKHIWFMGWISPWLKSKQAIIYSCSSVSTHG